MELTRKQIENMPSGHNMDELIHSRVFQGTRLTDDCYSIHMDAAWLVVSALNRRGFEVELKELLPYRGREDNLSRCHLTKHEDEEFSATWTSMADEMPLAICRAALLTLL